MHNPLTFRALKLFIVQIILYGTLTLNFRAVAAGDRLMTALTDTLIATLAFTAISEIAKATSRVEQVLYVAGSVIGAQIALWSTHHG